MTSPQLTAYRLRPLPRALAHAFAATKPGSLRMDVLNALFRRMTPREQLECRAEMLETKAARRGEKPATVCHTPN